MIHRRLLLATPRRQSRDPPPDLTQLGNVRAGLLAVEVYRTKSGTVEIAIGAENEADLIQWGAVYESVFPGGSLQDETVECPFPAHQFRDGLLARSRVARGHHWWPMKIVPGMDYSAGLARTLTSPFFREHVVLLQVLARPLPQWESGLHLVASPYDKLVMHLEGRTEPLLSAPTQRVPTAIEKDHHTQILTRHRDLPWHAEMRLGIAGPEPAMALEALQGWIRQWQSINSGTWWYWTRVRNGSIVGKTRALEFREAFASHSLKSFTNPKERRDVSPEEFGSLLPLPWLKEHPGFPYVGSPVAHVQPTWTRQTPTPTLSRPPRSLASPHAAPLLSPEEARHKFYTEYVPKHGTGRFGIRGTASLARPPTLNGAPPPTRSRALPRPPPAPTPRARLTPPTGTDLIVGESRGAPVHLPEPWTHLAVLGRTQSGKSTLVLNLALQILAKRPDATVVILEPTSGLIRDVVARVPEEVLSRSVEIDPAHPTVGEEADSPVRVPLGVLHIPDRSSLRPMELDRIAARTAGDMMTAIKNAWGEDSMGGRVDFILGAILQGLLGMGATNLVDAYYIYSKTEVRHRFLRGLPEGPNEEFLRVHLPKLDYAFTMSSLNKVGKISSNPMIRKALCQRLRPVTFEELLKHRLLLLNLSKGDLGTEGSNFLGAIFLTQLWAALQRSGSKDRPVFLVVDEFQNYAVPIFQDMLSEGAKFGLHVVAVTQYLHQVPPKVQAALHGNVKAWMFLSLGAEDMDLAWRISDAGRFGWVPQDFVNGLEDHQMGLAAGGSFAKIRTYPAPPQVRDAEAGLEAVREASSVYAQREDSLNSPFDVKEGQVWLLLGTLMDGPRDREEVARRASLLPDRAEVALVRCEQLGDITRHPGTGRIAITSRGRFHLAASIARRNEGEEHTEGIADMGAFLGERGIDMSVPEQSGGVLVPDGEFVAEGISYNLEVECSTIATHPDQAVNNVKKAHAAKRRCLVKVMGLTDAEALVEMLARAEPSFHLWQEFGIVWKEGNRVMVYRAGMHEVWSFLEPVPLALDQVGEVEDSDEGTEVPLVSGSDTEPAVRYIRPFCQALLALGKRQVLYEDFLKVIPRGEHEYWTRKKVGKALRALAIYSARVWRGEVQVRIYDLTPLLSR